MVCRIRGRTILSLCLLHVAVHQQRNGKRHQGCGRPQHQFHKLCRKVTGTEDSMMHSELIFLLWEPSFLQLKFSEISIHKKEFFLQNSRRAYSWSVVTEGTSSYPPQRPPHGVCLQYRKRKVFYTEKKRSVLAYKSKHSAFFSIQHSIYQGKLTKSLP